MSLRPFPDFTAFDLPSKRWMKLFCPKLRLRVRVQNQDFVSSAIRVDGQTMDRTTHVHWAWAWDDARFPRPSFDDNEEFEIEIERRFLLWYKCIRRTRRTSIDQIRTGDCCALTLYDGRQCIEMLEEGSRIGDITFMLWSDTLSQGNATYS